MADKFRVDAGELGQVSQELREATGSMAGAMHALDRASPQVAGHFALDGACAHFGGEWKFGLKQLNETLHAIGAGLDATAKAYRDTDAVIQGTLTGKVATGRAAA
ncbi:WXG100 family type VII secretion target [Kitasatospora purpeofusca]|uniref:WXG100 family type VII secretion target n=1 Tax=Kitasatospora purpeofusca TaxID=67352 RepID=UPI0036BEC185